jgi:hypothetical protein
MVVMLLPAASPIATWQDRTALPSLCTVQAPQRLEPQPNLVPVMSSTSRRTHNSGMSGGTSSACWCPLTVMVMAMCVICSLDVMFELR